jgi:hypothetical protein
MGNSPSRTFIAPVFVEAADAARGRARSERRNTNGS